MNAIGMGAGELGFTVQEAQELASILEEAGANSLHVRSQWLGIHQGSYLHEVLFYPEPHIPLKDFPKGLEIEDLSAVIRYLNSQVNSLGVETKLVHEFNASKIGEIKLDAVILATGGILVVPDIPGINSPNVIRSTELYGILRFFLRFIGPGILRKFDSVWMPVGKRVVIIGGQIQGCQMAEFLVK